jgi:hypothetical protein
MWYVNGIPTAGGNPFSYTPAHGDIISTALTSSYACPSPATVMSNNVTMTVDVTQTPAVTITVNPGSPICFGTVVTFTAHPLYGGMSPFISWAKNGITVATGPNYIYTPSNGDNVNCLLASSSVCRTADSVLSNNINIVTKSPTAMVASIVQSKSFIGVGENDTLVAIVVGAGPVPTYQWYINGTLVPGAVFSTFIVTGVAAGTQLVNCVAGSGDVCNTTKISNILTVRTVGVGVPQLSSAGHELKISPNPGKGIFVLNLQSAVDEQMTVVITNVLGEKVKEFTANTNSETEVMLNQPAGIYMVSAITAHGKYVSKIVVE